MSFTHLAIFSDTEDCVFIIAKLHTVNFTIMSSPAHCTLIPLHIYNRQNTSQKSDVLMKLVMAMCRCVGLCLCEKAD